MIPPLPLKPQTSDRLARSKASQSRRIVLIQLRDFRRCGYQIHCVDWLDNIVPRTFGTSYRTGRDSVSREQIDCWLHLGRPRDTPSVWNLLHSPRHSRLQMVPVSSSRYDRTPSTKPTTYLQRATEQAQNRNPPRYLFRGTQPINRTITSGRRRRSPRTNRILRFVQSREPLAQRGFLQSTAASNGSEFHCSERSSSV
jgi:hypothetical protein